MESWLDTFARANFQRSADTAHDLKTPLNVAVLNLELLRMRLRKIAPEDEKADGYMRAIETELRRMGHIFDAFFLLSTPPKNDEAPVAVDVTPLAIDAANAAGISLDARGNAFVTCHESRIRRALELFFEGASKILSGRQATAGVDSSRFTIACEGNSTAELEVAKIFKLYYTNDEGNPDLSLAVARLIAETYGGEVNAVEERDKVVLRLSLPIGPR